MDFPIKLLYLWLRVRRNWTSLRLKNEAAAQLAELNWVWGLGSLYHLGWKVISIQFLKKQLFSWNYSITNMSKTHVNTCFFSVCRFCIWFIVYMAKNQLFGEPQRCLHSNPHQMYSSAVGAWRKKRWGDRATGAVGMEAVCWAEPLGVYPEMLTQSISVKRVDHLHRISSCVSASGVIIDDGVPVEILNISDIIVSHYGQPHGWVVNNWISRGTDHLHTSVCNTHYCR